MEAIIALLAVFALCSACSGSSGGSYSSDTPERKPDELTDEERQEVINGFKDKR